MLTETEVAHFESFGFVVMRAALSPDEVARLTAEVDLALDDAFGSRYGRNTRTDLVDDDVAAEGNFLPLMASNTPLSASLVADDPRFLRVADQLLGRATVASPALATCLVTDTPWHNEGGLGERWLRFNAYLHPAAAATGALRVVPGSHHGDASERVEQYLLGRGQSEESPDLLPGHPIETQPGDVIAFDPRVRHAAFGGSNRLRWSVDFLRMPTPQESAAFDRTRSLVETLSDWPSPQRWPRWAAWSAEVAGPSRARAVRQLQELGVSLAT